MTTTQDQPNRRAKIFLAILFFWLLLIALFLIFRKSDNTPTGDETMGAGDAAYDPAFDLDSINPIGFNPTIPEYKGDGFIIEFGNSSDKNKLIIEATGTEIVGVTNAAWSLNNELLLFSKTEKEDCVSGFCIDDTSNIWVANADGSAQRQIFNYDEQTPINYISNNQKVAFVTMQNVGIINIDGSGLVYLDTMESQPTGSDFLSIPNIKFSDSDKNLFIIEFLEGGEKAYSF